MGSRAVLTGSWAALSASMLCVAVCMQCGGLQPIPPYAPMPSPAGGDDGFHCAPLDRSPSTASAPAPPQALPFDDNGAPWVTSGAFKTSSQPIDRAFVRAQNVHPAWSDPQKKLLSVRETRRETALVPLGGTYWKNTPYPIARDPNEVWVSSGFSASPGELPKALGNKAQGFMAKVFPISKRHLRFDVGGDNDPDVGVELLVEPAPGHDLSGCTERSRPIEGHRPAPDPSFAGYVPVFVARGRDHGEGLEPVDVDTTDPRCPIEGLQAALRVFDLSEQGHVNLGAVTLTDDPPPSPSSYSTMPVWGMADFHTHPTSNLAFGGLQGVHTIWGAPGGSMANYVGDEAKVQRNIARDIPPCDDPAVTPKFNGHQGGYAAPIMINAAESRISASTQDLGLADIAYTHSPQGAPSFAEFPDFRRGAHQPYHISQIHRAYLGGLRLMTALAVQNQGLEYGMGWVRCDDGGSPTVDTTDDLAIVRAHVRSMRELAQLNSEWMEIAYSPEQARDIIQHDKLAVVLGVEVDQLGQTANVAAEVDDLNALGIRQVVMIHAMDNLLGGTAVFEDLYNSVNDWLNRPRKYRDRVETLSGILDWRVFPQTFYKITTAPSPAIPLPDGATPPLAPTEPIEFRLGNPPRVVLSDMFPRPDLDTYKIPFVPFTFGVLHPLVATVPINEIEQGPYDKYAGGHRNSLGLSGRGVEYVKRLMERGMLVDLAHESDETLKSIYEVTNEACSSYPLMVSHAHFRALALKGDYSDRVDEFTSLTSAAMIKDLESGTKPMNRCVRYGECDESIADQATRFAQRAPQLGPGSVNRENLPREFDIASSELQQVDARGGTVGVFLSQSAEDTSALDPSRDLPAGMRELPFANDCAGTTKSFAVALLFANARLKNATVGVASDYGMVGSVGPRFGVNACPAYQGAGTGSASSAQLLDELLAPDQYRFGAQKDPVQYQDTSDPCAAQDWVNGAGGSDANGSGCGDEKLERDILGQRTYDFNTDGLAHYGLLPDMMQDTANVLHDETSRRLALDNVFGAANGFIEMWAKARRLSRCESTKLCNAPVIAPDPLCAADPPYELRAECGSACPCAWNGGAPLQEIDEKLAVCDPGKAITFPVVDSVGHPKPADPKYRQHQADPMTEGHLTMQGDWGVYPLRERQLWSCGGDTPKPVDCPSSANYVKVRRVLDTTVSTFTERCDYQPLPPEVGDRRVIFQCLVGPAEGEFPRATR